LLWAILPLLILQDSGIKSPVSVFSVEWCLPCYQRVSSRTGFTQKIGGFLEKEMASPSPQEHALSRHITIWFLDIHSYSPWLTICFSDIQQGHCSMFHRKKGEKAAAPQWCLLVSKP
jgi:hypothetical protein